MKGTIMEVTNDLERASGLLKAVPSGEHGTFVFCADNGILMLRKDRSLNAHKCTLLRLSSTDVSEGLTSTKWGQLDSAIRTARKEGTLK